MWSARDFLPLTDVNGTGPTAHTTNLARAAIGPATALADQPRKVAGLMLPARSGP